ncbi:hypothetical protein NLJ89_g4016 [Agrocybe chaxingu]|uniref:glucan 1,3-beta-glucosidase n=1 Tax=Agrocybe chaxingu TaxID=84603 RepID=A0A9W8K446_9AGAR|nr:hypothetical protein NLJ89_g4016 [Agrocybe chaxingu]
MEDGTKVYLHERLRCWSPRVGKEEWVWGEHVVKGVNLGGWLVTEPFIVPALYEEYVGKSSIEVLDEWTLSIAMGADLSKRMEEHYKTFITEKDFAEIAGKFVGQPQYRDVVGIVGIVNEILWGTIGQQGVQSFYYAAYEAMRKASGIESGPYIAIHEGFQGPAIWEGFLSGADRVALDQHPYLAFMGDTTSTLNGIGSTPNFPDCESWDNWAAYTPERIASLKKVALASMDALQNFFFWTWKIGNSTTLGTSSCPMWHYRLGLQQGWIPKDPREAIGHCAQVLSSSQIFDGKYPSTATGGVGAGTLDPVQSASHTFPPPTISPSFTGTQVAMLPTYTPTGTLKTLFAPTFTAAPSAVVGTGWNNPADNQPAYVPIAGCSYPEYGFFIR